MALKNVSDDIAKEAARELGSYLSRSIPVMDIKPVTADFVQARVGGRGLDNQLPEYSIYLRVKTSSVDSFDILSNRSEVNGHIGAMIIDADTHQNVPDSVLVGTDHPPSHINKPLVFFVEVAI